MGIFLSKFLNTSQHFSSGSWIQDGNEVIQSTDHFNTVNTNVFVWDTSEDDFQTPAPFDFTLRRMRVKAIGNSGHTCTIGFRVNGVTVASVPVTIVSSGVWEYTTSAQLNVQVQAGDFMNLVYVPSPLGLGDSARVREIVSVYEVGLA